MNADSVAVAFRDDHDRFETSFSFKLPDTDFLPAYLNHLSCVSLSSFLLVSRFYKSFTSFILTSRESCKVVTPSRALAPPLRLREGVYGPLNRQTLTEYPTILLNSCTGRTTRLSYLHKTLVLRGLSS